MFSYVASTFANLKIKTKVIFGFACVLAILAAVSVMAYIAFDSAKEATAIYAQRVAVARIATDIDRKFSQLRRHVREFAHTGQEEEAKAAGGDVTALQSTIEQGLATIQNPSRHTMIEEISQKFGTYTKGFEEAAGLKREQDKLISETLDPTGQQSRLDFDGIVTEAEMAKNGAASALANAGAEKMLLVRLNANKLLSRHDAAAGTQADQFVAELKKSLDDLDTATTGISVHGLVVDIRGLAERYAAAYHQAQSLDKQIDGLVNGTMVADARDLDANARLLMASANKEAQSVEDAMKAQIAWTQELMLILAAAGLGVGIAIAWFMGSAIAKPIVAAADTISCLARGDEGADVTVTGRRDEIGIVQEALATLKATVAAAFRTSQILEQLPTNVMTCSLPNFEIVSMNDGTRKLLRNLEAQGLLPCPAGDMMGRSIDMFHKTPSHQRRILGDPKNLPHRAQIRLGSETIALSISAVRNRAGEYVGPMLVWNVVTAQMTLAEEVNQVAASVSSGTTQLEASAQALSATAEEGSSQAASVAAASEQMASNVQMVAIAAEELASSIQEIGRQVANAAAAAQEAVERAGQTDRTVQELADTAQRIGSVVQLINSIAGQTNLLALNATIEAARAGDAGKGFAVVASEVKSLATQTAKATEEIGNQIDAMQSVTHSTVDAIREISAALISISAIATAIASAVEEQQSATQEIARNVQQAAAGTQEVSSTIAGVTEAAGQTGAAASQVLAVAGDLANQSQALRDKIDRFIKDTKAA